MNIYKKLSLVTVVLFLIGILITVIYLFNLPDQLMFSANVAAGKWHNISGIFYNTYLVIGIELSLGIASIIFLTLANRSSDNVSIVYVDKYTTSKKDNEDEQKNKNECLFHKRFRCRQACL